MSSTVSITYAELEGAFDTVSCGAYGDTTIRICRRTGRSYCRSLVVGSDEDSPEDLDDDKLYLAIPHKSDLNLGRDVVFQFVKYEAPEIADRVFDAFRKKGAYSTFKSILAKAGLLDRWYEFEAQAKRAALTEWARENDVEIVEEPRQGESAAGASPP